MKLSPHFVPSNNVSQRVEEADYVTVEENVADNKALVWKQDLRIVPLCAGIYLLCYLDRSNIGRFYFLSTSCHSQGADRK